MSNHAITPVRFSNEESAAAVIALGRTARSGDITYDVDSGNVITDDFASTDDRGRIAGYLTQKFGMQPAEIQVVMKRMGTAQKRPHDPEPKIDLPSKKKAERQAALATLLNRASSKKERLHAADIIRHQGEFSPFAADTLMSALENTRDPQVREKIAEAYYLLFYRPTRDAETYAHLISAEQLMRFERFLSPHARDKTKTFLIQATQLMISGYGEWNPPKLASDLSDQERLQAESLAKHYVPILIGALFRHLPTLQNKTDDEALATIRNEITIALDNLSVTEYARSEEVITALRRWNAIESDEWLADWLTEHEIYGPLVADPL